MPRPQPAHRASRPAASRHGRPARLNRGRVGALVAAVTMTLVIGATSAVTQLRGGPASADVVAADGSAPSLESAALPVVETAPEEEPAPEDVEAAAAPEGPALPAESGEGRRVVFSESEQQVWLVGDDGEVERTYPVSGSRFDNLDPGSYSVTSRTRNATAFDYSGTMEYFVRFTEGRNAPIGFHTVPKDNDGELEQTKAQLGTPLSAGCVRQWEDDAIALWEFAPVGTPVIVTP